MFNNKNKLGNLFLLSTLVLLVVFVLGGCLAKEIKQVKNNPQPVFVDKKVELENEKIGADEIISEEKNNEKISINKEVVNSCKDNLDIKCWDTYRNEEYGFELKYPKKINEEIDMEMQTVKYDENRVVVFFSNKKGSFSIFPKGEFDMGLGFSNGSKNILISGKKATREEYDNLSYITFEDKKEIDKFFRIELNYYKGYENDKNLKNILNEILQTFKFFK